jgi:predicted phage terminase large subunit-like protein
MDLQAAAQELIRRRNAASNIYDYIDFMESTGLLDVKYKPAKHHKLIIDDLHRMINGECDKEAFSLPPGSAKSTYISVILPTFLMVVDPTQNILCISNSEGLAEDFARRRRTIMRSEQWKLLSNTSLQPDAQSLGSMSTVRGGVVYAAGAGSTITGLRADWIIMDDLVKGFEQANSITQLDKIWNWLLSDARSRLKPNGRELIVATRWSALDPIGRVIELTEDGKEDWKYIRIPMECDTLSDPLGRDIGDALWTEWFTPKMLNDAKRDPAIWICLYQQSPLTSTGEWLPPEHIKLVANPPKLLRYIIGVDIALTISDKSDYTVFAVMGIDEDKNLCLVDLYRVQDSVDITARALVKWCELYNPTTVLLDDDNASKVYARLVWEESRKQGVPVPLKMVPTRNRDKETRAAPLRSYFLQGRITILQAPWNTELLYELSRFPVVRHDDQVDAMGLPAAELIKISAPKEPDQVVNTKKTVIGLKGGKLVLNESLDDLFSANEAKHQNRFANKRI